LETKQRTWGTWGRLFRVAFLPIMVIIFGLMAVPVLSGLQMAVTPLVFGVVALAVAAQIFWFCYGTVLNDYYDQDIDGAHPFGSTPFTEGYFTEREKRRVVWSWAGAAALCEAGLFAYIALSHPKPLIDALAYAVFLAFGVVLATVYSLPPVQAKRRFLGPAYTLLLVFVTGFLRFCLVFGGWEFLVLNSVYIFGISLFLYLDHLITSISLKDIGDFVADAKGGARTVPIVLGLRPALYISVIFLVATTVAGILLVVLGWLRWWFLFTYAGLVAYFYLYKEMNGWIDEVSRDRNHFYKVPIRKKFLVFGYILNWGIWMPAFMLALDGNLLL
jgi:4-hydroxybenzoate polyprenyltransferase